LRASKGARGAAPGFLGRHTSRHPFRRRLLEVERHLIVELAVGGLLPEE